MKRNPVLSRAVALVSVGAVALLIGCGKEEAPQPQTPPPVSAAPPAQAAPAPAPAPTPTAPATPPAAPQKPPVSTAPSLTTLATNAVVQAQALLDRAKTMVANKQYAEALVMVQQLSTNTLTPEQQKALGEVKAQMQAAVTASAISNAVTSATKGTAATNVSALSSLQSTDLASQANVLIEQAKGLVTNKNYKEALGVLQQLTTVKLTPEQQKLVTDLKTQAQAAMASSALTNFFGGRK